ncbi:E3 ubiquitin-protein ligase DCST1-like [Drosophila kikkawai]|uniref:E3 ubiquitin-protein ligase DCST1-like n=1 Tax=Drosophila kikkawai TaxID=30033 RepID=A0ABM4GHB7_DROKI
MVIKGGGQIGSFLRDLVHAFEPKVLQMNSYNCLPVPENPKYWLYFWILVLYVLAWIMVFWEPYGLRQRHRIMAYFHPEVSCRRVQYLHYSILKGRRKSVLQLSSQRARFLKCYRYDNKLVSCISCLSSLTSWFFSGCRGVCIGRSCTICRKPLTKSDHVFCDLPECSGVYCYTCFIECNNNCVLCSSPSECDFSEIGDSSDYWDYSYCCPENVHSE